MNTAKTCGNFLLGRYNLKKSESEEFLKIAKGLYLKVETRLFNLEDLQDALILAKHGKLEQHNDVIKISE